MGKTQWFILLYFIGAYIKLYKKEINKKRGLVFLYPIILIILYASLECNKYSESLEIIKIMTSMNSIFVLVESIILFFIFKQLKIKNNKIINVAGKASSGVYLIHDNYIIRDVWWDKILNVKSVYNENLCVLILHVMISVILIYIVGIFVELFRLNVIEKNIFRIKKLNSFCNVIDNKIE